MKNETKWTKLKNETKQVKTYTLSCIMLKNGQIYFKNLAV